MKSFKKALNNKIKQSLKNNYGIDNYDEFRFGSYNENLSKTGTHISLVTRIKEYIKNLIGFNSKNNRYFKKGNDLTANYSRKIGKIWSELNKNDKELLVELLAYRILGYKKVKLSRNNQAYRNAIEKAHTLTDLNETYDPNFMHFILKKFNLNPIGYDIKFYFTEVGVAIDYIIEQYAYKLNNKNLVEVKSNDTVLDIGGCWGDTALYFAHKTGSKGKVYSFEFIPENINLFKKNIALNESVSQRIELVEHPVSDKSGQKVYFKDFGPGSSIEFSPFEDQSGEAETITIDDFVKSKKDIQIDFIKMDIEGAETMALKGAINTIKKFRPKLAIAIYHSIDDLFNIPSWILDLNLDYQIYIGHYTIHIEETICFAIPKNKF